MKKLLSATAMAVVLLSVPAFAASPEELQTQLEALKQTEAAKNAEIAALRKKIKTLEASRSTPLAAAPAETAMAAAGRSGRAVDMTPWAPSWEGLYVGFGGSRNVTKLRGGDATQFSTNGTSTFTDTLSLGLNDTSGAGQIVAGYMWQFNKLLLGIEGDYTFNSRTTWGPLTGLSGGHCGVSFTGAFDCAAITPFGSFETLGHLRAVAGWELTPRVMGFVSGGVAFAKASAGTHSSAIIASSPSQPTTGAADSVGAVQNMVGGSIGGGFQIKMSENVIARFEYLHDFYAGVHTPGSFLSVTNGIHNDQLTDPGSTFRMSSDSVRASLLYRFGPNASPYASTAGLWDNFTTAPGLYDGRWTGLYGGGGVTQNNYLIKQDGGKTLTIDDSNTPGVDVSVARDMTLGDGVGITSGHLLFGGRYQWNRFIVGVEGDWDFGSEKTTQDPPKGPGQFGGNTNGQDCYTQFGANIVCIGGGLRGQVSVKSKGHLRFTGGIAVTPDLLAFASAGLAFAEAGGTIGGDAAGIVASPPSAPLVGAATVTRSLDKQSLSGHTIGGGFELKASDAVSIRGEYYHDWYTWQHLPVGGAGFGGTIGTITTNSFTSIKDTQTITNNAYRLSLIYRWNPLTLFH